MRLFIDTWGWLTLRDRRESRHGEIKDFYTQFREEKGIAYTSDYVLDETITLLFKRLPFNKAAESLANIDEALKKGYLRTEWITPERFEEARGLRLKYHDKPRVSFTDLTSMVVMKETRINDILTEDEHFEHVGMGFMCKP